MTAYPSLNPAFIGTEFIREIRAAYRAKGGLLAHRFNAAVAPEIAAAINVYYLSDNDSSDLARKEVKNRLRQANLLISAIGETPPTSWDYDDIPAQDWRAGAFEIAQLARDTARGPGDIIFLNCAPRLAQAGKHGNNKGEDVYIGMLRNGTVVAAVSPHSFAYFRDLVEANDVEFFRVNVQTEGSQFRSRDFFPWFSQVLAHNLAHGAADWKENLDKDSRRAILQKFNFIDTEHKLTLEDIPDLTAAPFVAYTDIHGNLKLTVTRDDIDPELLQNPVRIEIKGRTFFARFRDCMFDYQGGSESFAEGSSGDWPDSRKQHPKFLQLAVIGQSLRDNLGLSALDLRQGVPVRIELHQKGNVLDTAPGFSDASHHRPSVT